MEDKTPELGKAAFGCPYCKAYAQQAWFDVWAKEITAKDVHNLSADRIRDFIAEQVKTDPDANVEFAKRLLRDVEQRLPGIGGVSDSKYVREISNAHVSRCFVCDREALWLGDQLTYPRREADVAEPNLDLPPDVKGDYEEAALVLADSPRSAAALLRLALQKLCSFLVGRHGDIDEMIGELVKRGLSPMIQQALDVVRVIGNEAVHPGTIDLRDDHGTASRLFTLINLVAEAMITQPRHVQELYSSLPPNKLKGIEDRNAKALKKE